jgi:hypothetical protein
MLVLCEGEKTEPNYFGAIRHELCLSTIEVDIVGKGVEANRLVKEAKEAAKRKEADDVWCVFDCDGIPQFPGLIDDCAAARPRVHAAASNPCIEFWFLLHYGYTTAELSQDDAMQRLKTKIPGYDKSKLNVYELIKDREEDAMGNAERLREYHQGNDSDPKTCNPCTSVDELVKSLRELAQQP